MISDHRVDGLIVMGEISRAYLRKLEKEAGMPMIFWISMRQNLMWTV